MAMMRDILERVRKEDPVKGNWYVQKTKKGGCVEQCEQYSYGDNG